MNKKLLSIMASIPLAIGSMYGQVTTTYNFTGAMQTFTVPCGVTSIHIDALGGQGGSGATGGNGSTGGAGGLGGSASGDLAVTPGDVINIFVGGSGSAPTGGFNGGANGGSTNAGGGGGASDVRVGGTAAVNRVIVAGGGGGGGRAGCEAAIVNGGGGGLGGNTNGSNGTDAATPGGVAGGGAGGTISAGGAAGIGCGGFLGQPGVVGSASGVGGVGGAGQACCCFTFPSVPGGGGGGGGFIGGGGGGGGSAGTTGCSGNDKGAGGGGSGGSNYTGGVTAPISSNGNNVGNGIVTITYTSPTPALVNGTGPSSFCAGSNATFVANNDPNTNTYTWSVDPALSIVSGQGTNTMTFTGSVAGTYTVQVYGSNTVCVIDGPVATINITVNALPSVTTNTSALTVCNGDMVTLFGQGATSYVWSGGITDNTPFPATSTSTYTVTGTDANGCVNTATASVTVNPLPVVDLGLDQTVCALLVLDAGNAGSTFMWSDATTAQTLTATATGTYSVTVTDANGCVNSDAVSVTVNPLPNVNANAIPGTTLCEGDTVTAFGTGAVTYVWSGGVIDGMPFVPPVGTPSYTLTGTDANGCVNTFVGTLTVNALPTVTGTSADNSVCLSDAAVALTGSPANGTWSGPGVTGSSFNPTTAGVGTQTATYTFTDANMCTNTASTSIVVSACVGINEGNILESGITVFPNPTSGIFNINVNANVGDMTIEVVDVEGRVVFSSNEKNVQTGFSKSISLVGMPNGVYLVNLKSASEHATHTVTLTK